MPDNKPTRSSKTNRIKSVPRRRAPLDPLFDRTMPSMTACGMLVLGCIIGAGMWRDWVWLLDTFTLALHEAGHPMVGFFSARLMVYGGTFFQLLFPWLTKLHFKKKGSAAGVVFALYWMAASVHNVGIYMADARAKALPLVGGLDPDDAHDWAEILYRWGLLKYDTTLGKMLMLGAWVLLGWAMWRCYKEVHDTGFVPKDKDAAQFGRTTVNKEDALVERYRHLQGRTESNMAHRDKLPASEVKATSPAQRPEQEEQG